MGYAFSLHSKKENLRPRAFQTFNLHNAGLADAPCFLVFLSMLTIIATW